MIQIKRDNISKFHSDSHKNLEEFSVICEKMLQKNHN